MDGTQSFSEMAMALSLDYESVYFVDIETDRYAEYSSRGGYRQLQLDYSGNEFWGDVQKNLKNVVFEADQGMLSRALTKENVLTETADGSPFTLNYRLLIDGEPTWYTLKSVHIQFGDKNYLVVGVCNVDSLVRQQKKLEQETTKSATYGQIALALANQYVTIYCVNRKTDHYAEYKAKDFYKELANEESGDDFWGDCQKNLQRVIYEEDRELLSAVLVKDTLLKELDNSGSFSYTYRLLVHGVPTYMNMKAVASGDEHIVIAVSNIDAQVRREHEFSEALSLALEKSHRDSLTGVKNKNAFVEFENRLDHEIQSGACQEFAVAICDVNGLKEVNDTKGHKAGDEYICGAAKLVCEIFKHSPVFRIGGDEFAVILRDFDYRRREDLQEQIDGIVQENQKKGGVVVACGMACFEPANDKNVAQVFERADRQMYSRKKALKHFG